jgi:N-acetylglucosaminyldiphosphoundecaprenol N-acetyl-beta-D-mannosaminyltransferase
MVGLSGSTGFLGGNGQHAAQTTSLRRANVLGVGISAVSMADVLDAMESWIARRERNYVCAATVHSVMECQRDEALRRALNASAITAPDGMPLVWCSRGAGYSNVTRVCGPDLLPAFCERSVVPGYRHFFYGGAPGVPELLAERLSARFHGLQVAGAYSPPFRTLTSEEQTHEIRRLNQAEADVIWIGLGAPKQERWMAEHRDALDVPLLVGVGAAFDFHAGLKRQAPPWMQRHGLEWLFRLREEPRRLWHRYLVYNPAFLIALAGQVTGLRRYRID